MAVRRLTDEDELVPAEQAQQMQEPRRMGKVRRLTADDEIIPAEGAAEPTERAQAGRESRQRGTGAGGSTTSEALQSVMDVAGDFNTGMLRPFGDAALGLAEKVGIVGGDATEPAKSASQGAARMAGEAVFGAGALAFPFLRGNQMRLESQRFINSLATGKGSLGTQLREGLRQTAESAARRPGATFGMEAAAGAGAGAAGTAVELEGGSSTQRLFGELLGGAGTAGALTGTAAVARLAPAAQFTRSIVNAMREGTVQGVAPGRSRQRAASRVRRGIDAPPEDVLRRADEADVLPGLTVAERSGEEGLLRMERSVYDTTEELSRAQQQRFTDINQAIIRSVRDLPGQTGETEASPQDARAYLDGLVATRLDQATAIVQDHLQGLGPRATRETANRLARREIDKALEAAMDQERELWSLVPGDLTVPLERAQGSMQTILRDLAGDRVKRSQNIIPTRLRDMLGRIDPESGEFVPGRLGEAATVNEVRSLRDEIRRATQTERARPSPNGTRLHFLNQLNESLLADLDTLGAEPGDALDLARGFSRDVNSRFRKGDVGKLLGHTAEGGERTPEGLTLEATIGQGQARGREAADRVLEAAGLRLQTSDGTVGDIEALRGNMTDFIRDEFRRAAAPDGELDVRAAQRYVTRRAELLGRFPELRNQIDEAIAAGDHLAVTRDMVNPRKSRAAVFLGRDMDQAMDSLVRDSNAPEAARNMREMLDEDPTGRALEGARRALMDTIIKETRATGTGDLDDTSFVSGKRMREFLENPRMQSVVKRMLNDEQIKRLETLKNTALSMDRARTAIPSQEGVLGDRPGMMAKAGARMAGAIGGRWVARWTGGGSVQMPGIGANVMTELQRRGLDPAQMIVVDAVTRPDEKLFRALMTDVSGSPRRQKVVNRRLNAWALAAAAEHGIRVGEEEVRKATEQEADAANQRVFGNRQSGAGVL